MPPDPVPNCSGMAVVVNGVTIEDHRETKQTIGDHGETKQTAEDHGETKQGQRPDSRGRVMAVDNVMVSEPSSFSSRCALIDFLLS